MNRHILAWLACPVLAFGQASETAADLAARYLPELIRLDTTNPPGNETRVARYLKQVADRVAVMRHGEIVEEASAGEIFARPQHAYTRNLLASAPTMRTARGLPLATLS